ncbi:MAG: hypothetical protein SVU88_00110 [Candidatus Nanohaloarchaea archaeon]|nr:hypothetical protein [Candidatus Nanohaloarchaea archaeon]
MGLRMVRWVLAFVVALGNDILDIYGPGALPIAADTLDVATTVVLFPLVGGPEPFITATELIPLADILPIFTAVTLWAFLRHG